MQSSLKIHKVEVSSLDFFSMTLFNHRLSSSLKKKNIKRIYRYGKNSASERGHKQVDFLWFG